MATLIDGNYLNQYVAPQLLNEFKNDKDDFLGVLAGAPAAAVSADGIRFNKLINNVDFLVDNTDEFTPASMSGKKGLIEWEKYDTAPTQVTDAEMQALPYDKRSAVRQKHTEAFKRGIRDHVLWKLAPDDNTSDDMPVVRTTGDDDGNGRLRMTFKDLVNYLEKIKKLNLVDMSQLYMILCPEHATDLIIDRDSANYFSNANIFFDPTTGKVRSIMGFKFFENNATLAYDSDGAKKAKGATLATTDRNASLFFYAPNTVYHLNSTKILYVPEYQDTRNADPTSEFRTQTYGLVDRIQEIGVGALVSGISA